MITSSSQSLGLPESSTNSSDHSLQEIERKIKAYMHMMDTNPQKRIPDHIGSDHQLFNLASPSSILNSDQAHSNIKHETSTPLDIKGFNERVKTFQIATWFNKPYNVNPLECARYGFINYSQDKIQCSQCQSKLILKTEFEKVSVPSEVIEKRCESFREELKSCHLYDCIFYNQPSPLRFTLFCHQDTSSGKNKNIIKLHCFNFHRMLKKLLQLQSTHDLKLDLSSEFLTKYHNSNNEFVETTMNEMKSNVEHLKSSESSVTASLFWLSVFHWEVMLKTFNNGSEKDYFLHCEHCQMSHYLKKAIRGRLLTTEEPLNPAAMHRWWCPCVHHNKLLTDYEQINEDEESKFYSKSLIKRQLNELPGWSQMLDSLKQDSKISNQHAGLIGLALLNHEHLPNEYDASLLVKNILQNSLSSIFVSENERRQWLRKQFEKPNETREGKVAVLASKQDANDLQPSLETVVPRVEHPTAPEATSSTSGSNKEDSEPSPTTMTTVSPVQTPTTVEAPTTDQPPHVHTSSDVTRSTSHESLVIKDPMSFSINLAPTTTTIYNDTTRTPTTQLESSFISPFSTTTNYQEMGTASLTRADKEGIQSPLSGPYAAEADEDALSLSSTPNTFSTVMQLEFTSPTTVTSSTAHTPEEPYTLSPPIATSPALDLSTNDSEITNHQTFTADDMLETRETMIEEDQQQPMHETTAEASSGLLTPVKADTFIQLEPSTSHTTPSIASVSSPVPSNTLAVTTPTVAAASSLSTSSSKHQSIHDKSTTARKAEISTTTPSKPPSSISSSSKTTSSSSSSSSNTTPNKLTSTPKDSSHSSGSTSTPNKSRKQQSTRQSSNKKQSTPNSDNTATLSNTPSSKQFRQSGSNKQGNATTNSKRKNAQTTGKASKKRK